MRKEWGVKKLGDVCVSDLGKTLNKSKDTGILLPYLCSINVQWNKIDLSTQKEALFEENDINKYSVKKGDLLVCEGGDIGRAAIWTEDYSMLYQNALHRMRFDKNIIAEYVLYFLWQLKRKGVLDNRYAKGVTIKHLVKSSLLSINIPVPPLQTQQQIVEEIECLTSIIEKHKKQLEELDNLAQSIFYDMFGDPIENEKGWGKEKITKVAPIEPDQGDIPEKNGMYWLLNLDMIQSNKRTIHEKVYVQYDEVGTSTIKFNKDNVLYSKLRPYLNKVVIPDESGFCTSELVPFKPNESIILKIFLCYVLSHKSFVDYISSKVIGAKMPRVSMDVLRGFNVITPPLPLQQQFASKIEAIEKQKELIKKSIKETEDLFNSRMDYYFN